MAQERILKQVVVSGFRTIGYILGTSGTVNDPDLAVEEPVDMVIGKADFENPEDWHTLARLVTRATRVKVTRLLEENKRNEIHPNAS